VSAFEGPALKRRAIFESPFGTDLGPAEDLGLTGFGGVDGVPTLSARSADKGGAPGLVVLVRARSLDSLEKARVFGMTPEKATVEKFQLSLRDCFLLSIQGRPYCVGLLTDRLVGLMLVGSVCSSEQT
jgi:hypothetical protein